MSNLWRHRVAGKGLAGARRGHKFLTGVNHESWLTKLNLNSVDFPA